MESLSVDVVASYCFSILSIIFYSIVYYPQFYEIYKTKSINGISIWMLLLWGQADILSLIGSILLDLTNSVIIMGWYHVFIGILMVSYVLYYDICLHGNQYKLIYVIIYYTINISVCLYLNITFYHNEVSGTIIGWVTAVIYIIGRIPQIMLNINRKSTKGLSKLMYVFTICGNLSYVLSVISYSREYDYIMLNLPWIFMTFITVSLDIFVIYQCYKYKNNQQNVVIQV